MKILIATGGTGGHIFPALQTAAALKAKGQEIFFAGVFKSAKEKIASKGYPLFEISAQGFSAKSLKTLLASVSSMVKSLFECREILGKVRPDVVLGFGGYGAFPVVLLAGLSGCPTIIHEQNVRPGKANRLLAWLVRRVAVSFEQSEKFFPSKKTVCTGYPCRPVLKSFNRKDFLARFNLSPDRYTILILGGSQGSQRINTAFSETIDLLKERLNFQVIHACGEKDLALVQERYDKQRVAAYVSAFIEEMAESYSVANLVIGRAGAGTVTEIAAFGLPTIFIPYPFAGGHQKENALVLAEGHGVRIIDEKDLTPELLGKNILALAQSPLTRDDVKLQLQRFYRQDAADLLAEEAMRLGVR